ERGTVKALAACLEAMTKAVVREGAAPATAATAVAPACVRQLRKLADSRRRGLSLPEKMAAAVAARCDPASHGVTHTIEDVTGKGPGRVGQPLDTVNIDAWCEQFGGDGSIDTVAEWIGCLQQSHESAARVTVSAEFPRVVEWLGVLVPAMEAVP